MFRKIIRSLILLVLCAVCCFCCSNPVVYVGVTDVVWSNPKVVMWLPKQDDNLMFWLKNDLKNDQKSKEN